MPNGKLDEDGRTTPEDDSGHVFTPETDELIREIKTLQYMVREPSRFETEAARRREPKLRDALVALRDRLRRRHKPSRGE